MRIWHEDMRDCRGSARRTFYFIPTGTITIRVCPSCERMLTRRAWPMRRMDRGRLSTPRSVRSVSSVRSVRQMTGAPVADPLDDLHQHDQDDHDDQQHTGFVAIVAVLDGHVSDTARTDGADHGRSADQ